MTRYFNRFAISMTKAEASAMYHEDELLAHLALPKFRRQFAKISPDDIRAQLREYDEWDDDELADDGANQERILWITAGDVLERPTCFNRPDAWVPPTN